MVITVTSFKGGVGKTTSAVHLAAYCGQKGPALLVDGDPNRSATAWQRRGGFPFDVLDEREARGKLGRYAHVVIDTEARPALTDLRSLAAGCDLLVIPSTPDVLALDALMQTVAGLPGENYRILLTIVPPRPSRAGEEVRATLKRSGWPVFRSSIRRLAAFPRAALAGCLVQDVAGDQRAALGWQDYQSAGKEIMR